MKKNYYELISGICNIWKSKILKRMRIVALLILISITQTFALDAYAQNKRLNLNVKNETIVNILEEIENQSEFYFMFDASRINVNQIKSVDCENQLMRDILDQLFENTGITYSINDRQVLLTVEKSDTDQQISISGTVSDQSGAPLPGVTIVVKGTTQGTVTDANGKYSLSNVSEDATLVFSFVGMITQETPVAGKTTVNINMAEQTLGIEEVVAVGYAVQKKETLTGSVSQVSGEQLVNRPTTNVVNALQGVIPNLNVAITNAGGEPGATPHYDIRGYASISGGSPLAIVDGVEQSIEYINPNDIESISVLKDATATAIYGSRAAFGVINIITKRGQNQGGKVNITVNSNTGWSKPTVIPEGVNSLEFMSAFNDAHINAGLTPYFKEEYIEKAKQYLADPNSIPSAEPGWNGDYDLYSMQWAANTYANTDWFDVFYKDWTLSQSHQINMQGGGSNAQYYFSGSLFDQDGMLNFGGENYKRYNFLGNVNAKINDMLSLKINTRYTRENYDFPYSNPGIGNFYHLYTRAWPTMALRDPNGNLGYRDLLILDDGGRSIRKENELVNSIHFIFEPLKNWKINAEINFRQRFNNDSDHKKTVWRTMVDGVSQIKQAYTFPNQFSRSFSTDYYNTNNIYSTYNLEKGKSSIIFLAGYQTELFKYVGMSGNKFDLLSDAVPSLITAMGDDNVSDNYGHWSTVGYFGRINYSFADKYLLEIVGRLGGSSRFPKNKRYGFFPGVSIGYNIAKEAFWGSLAKTINQLKFRASYGEVGNQDVPNYLYLPNMGVKQNLGWIMSGARPNYITPANIVSSDITWETVRTTDLGVDASFFENKLNFVFDYFNRQTLNMLGPSESLPELLGTSAPKSNNADLETKGFETEIGWRDKIGGLRYNVRFTISDSKTTITRFKNETGSLTNYYVGKTIGEIWGFTSVGLYQTAEEVANGPDQSYFYSIWGAGDMQYADLNGDGKINQGNNTLDDHGDLSIIGNEIPRYTYGIDVNLEWKNLDLKIFGQGVAKRDWAFTGSITNNLFYGIVSQTWQSSMWKPHMDYWRPDNTDAYYAKPYMSSETLKNYKRQTRYTQDASYFRLKNVQMGYTLPERIADRIKMEKVRIYVSAENVFVLTKLIDTMDPEALGGGYFEADMQYGEGKTHPLSTTLSVGLNVTIK